MNMKLMEKSVWELLRIVRFFDDWFDKNISNLIIISVAGHIIPNDIFQPYSDKVGAANNS